MTRLKSYRSRILLLSIASLILCFLLTISVVYFNVVRFVHDDQAKNVSSILDNYADTLDQFFRDNEASLLYLSDNLALKRVAEDPTRYEQELERRFKEFQDSHSEIKLISYGTELEQYFFDPGSNQVPPGYDPRVRPWYLKAKELGPDEIGYSDIYRDINTGDYIITMVKQIQDEDGNLAGVLGILLDLGYLSERNQANRIGDTGYTFITRDGKYLVNNALEMINADIEVPEFRQISLDQVSKSFRYDTPGDTLLVQAQYEPRADLTFWAIAHEAELLAPYWAALRNSILLTLLILMITILLVIRISKSMVREMGVMTKISEEMANGNLSARIHVKSSDEMQVFANHFNLMAERIEIQTNALIKNLLKLDQSYRETVTMISNAIEASDEYTKGHCERVAGITQVLGERCGLSKEQLKNLEYASLLHDVGKIGIDSQLLNKEEPLEPEEFAEIKRHSQIGYFILHDVEHLRDAADIVLHHHEWIDGKGYPSGLSEEEIRLESRIIAIADAFDAMTSARPYRKQPLTQQEALRRILAGKGTQFDARLVELLQDELRKGTIA